MVRAKARLNQGTSDLNLRLVPTGGGNRDAAVAETWIRVASPEAPSPRLRINSHEIVGLSTSGGIVVVAFDLTVPNSITNLNQLADGLVKCRGNVLCEESRKVITAGLDPGRALIQAGLPQGEKEIYLEVSQGTADGVEIVHAHERYEVNAPTASAPVVEFGDYEVLSYNDDGTANLALGFMAQKSADWEYTNLVAQVWCEDESMCSSRSDVAMDWSKADDSGGYSFFTQLEGLPPGDVVFNAIFGTTESNWPRARAQASLDGIEMSVPHQPEVELRWAGAEAEVLGYFMDGSALVRVTSSFTNIGSANEVNVGVERICLGSSEQLEDCRRSDASATLIPDSESVVVRLGDFKLPQGSNHIEVEANRGLSELELHVDERVVGITRDLWECFIDSNFVNGTTCGGFSGDRIEKWELEQVSVYRDGDPDYVAIFDESLLNLGALLGIDYVIVENYESANIEAYVGHEGHPRVIELTSLDASESPGYARWWSSTKTDSFDGGLVSVRKRHPDWRDEAISLEDEIRYTTIHELSHVLIPIGHDSRPFSPYRLVAPYYVRDSDIAIYQMIYSPLVKAGMTYAEVEDLIIFAEDTLDYDPERDIEIDVLVQKTRDKLQESSAFNVKMSGLNKCGSPPRNLPRDFVAWYWGFEEKMSNHYLVQRGDRGAIGFDSDGEGWQLTGGNWQLMEDHPLFSRFFEYSPYHTDPNRLLWDGLRHADDYTLSLRGDGVYVLRAFQLDELRWPQISLEIYVDPETGEMSGYKAEWEFGPDSSECPYYIDAEVLSYDEIPEIPDEVLSQSTRASLSTLGCAARTETSMDCHTLLELKEALAADVSLNWREGLHITKWDGVRLDGGPSRVCSLKLGLKDMNGTIPEGLGQLTELRWLHLQENRLTGSIPPELGDLAHLEQLRLGINRLTGTVPIELGELAELRKLDLQKNQLTGSIPPELGDLVQLEELTLGHNQLTGSVPIEIGELPNLHWLDINDNQIEGCIPINREQTEGFFDNLPICSE